MSSIIQVVTPNNLGSGLPVSGGEVNAVSVSRQVISGARSVFITTTNEVVPVEDWQPYIFGYFKIGVTPLGAQALADALTVTGGKVTMPAGMNLATVNGFIEFSQNNNPTWPAVFGQPSLNYTGGQLRFTWANPLSDFPYIKPFVSINSGFGRWKIGTVSKLDYDFNGGLLTVTDGNSNTLGSSYTNARASVTIDVEDDGASLIMSPVSSLTLLNAIQLENYGQFADPANPTPSEKLAFATSILRPALPTFISDVFSVAFADAQNVAYGENPDGTIIQPGP